MTNPNNAIGTNSAYDGRTSAKAFNDVLTAFTAGIMSGWECKVDSGLTVTLGGDSNIRDVALAENSTGDKLTINNISESPVSVTVGSAPVTNARVDSIVAYVDNPPQGNGTADNPEACGLIVVAGSVSSNPFPPNESTIRAAITADGASGTTAYYVVLANITIPYGTTDLLQSYIKAGDYVNITALSSAAIITMTDTDPGEGVDIEENHYIAVYENE